MIGSRLVLECLLTILGRYPANVQGRARVLPQKDPLPSRENAGSSPNSGWIPSLSPSLIAFGLFLGFFSSFKAFFIPFTSDLVLVYTFFLQKCGEEPQETEGLGLVVVT